VNAERYLSTKRIWIKKTPEIRALDGKSILIVDSEERQMRAHLRICDADPNGTDAGKCAVVVWATRVGEIKWENASVVPTPTIQTHSWQRFVTEDALDLIGPNGRDPTQGELMIILPIALHHSGG
jgi:hypothetical protein